MPPIQDLSTAERHRVVAGRFGELVARTTDWDAPAPVAGWTARDVVGHLTSWFPEFLEAGSGLALPAAGEDPRVAWEPQTSAIQSLLADPAAAGRPFEHRHAAGMSVAEAVDQFYTPDVFMHSWDLARASGQAAELDPGFCLHLLDGMEPFEEAMRSSGQYGAAVQVPADADAETRLIAYIGRDPGWRGQSGHAPADP